MLSAGAFFLNMSHNRKILYIVLLPFAIASASAESFAASLLKVTGDRVNMRAAPSLNAEVVGQVNSGDVLTAGGREEDGWVCVVPPDSVDLWISTRLLDGNKVKANRARVRSGASLNYHEVGLLNTGDTVEIRGTMGDWTRIAPVPEAGVWITNAYVKPYRGPTPAPEKKAAAQRPSDAGNIASKTQKSEPPVSAPQQNIPKTESVQDTKNTVSESKTAADAAPAKKTGTALRYPSFGSESPSPGRTLFGSRLAGESRVGPGRVPASKLKSNVSQAEPGTFTGWVAVAPSGSPTRYMLVSSSSASRPRTLCFLLGNDTQLSGLVESECKFGGAVYNYIGTAEPVIFVQNILLISGRKTQ